MTRDAASTMRWRVRCPFGVNFVDRLVTAAGPRGLDGNQSCNKHCEAPLKIVDSSHYNAPTRASLARRQPQHQ